MKKDNNNMDDAFILYQREIDALLKKGYQESLAWIKKASEEIPDASIEDLLKAAQSIVAASTVFSEDTNVVEEKTAPVEATHVAPVLEPLTVEAVELVKPVEAEAVDETVTFNSEYSPTTYAAAGSGFEVLDEKYDTEYKSDAIKIGEEREDNAMLEVKEKDYKRKEATGFQMGGDAEIDVAQKEYVPPSELIVDMSIDAPNIAPAPSEVVEDGYGYNTDITVHSKEYVAPDELIIDNSIKDDSVTSVDKEPVKKSLFGKKKVVEQPIAYLPPKEIDLGFDDIKNSNLELEEVIPYQPKNKIVNEANSLEAEAVTENSSSKEVIFDEDSVVLSKVEAVSEVDYNKLAAELAAEKFAAEEAERIRNEGTSYEYNSDTASSNEEYIDEDDLTEEQRRLALRFPARPNINSRQIIKDIRSIDLFD
jgi:hypothetical protein